MAMGGANGELEEAPPIPAPPSSVRPDVKPQPRPGALLEYEEHCTRPLPLPTGREFGSA